MTAKDFFGNEIKVGDKVAALGTHYKKLFLYEVLAISVQKVRLRSVDANTHPMEAGERSKFHYQCIVKNIDRKW